MMLCGDDDDDDDDDDVFLTWARTCIYKRQHGLFLFLWGAIQGENEDVFAVECTKQIEKTTS